MNDSSKSSNEQQQPLIQPYYAQAPYEEDEINLVDLWVVLSSYKVRFFKTFIVVALLAACYVSFFHKTSFEMTTTIQIGTYTSTTGEIAIETPEALLSKVLNSIEPIYTNQWKLEKSYEKIVKTNITNPKGSNIIVIKNKVTSEEIELFDDFQLQLAEKVVLDHQNIIVSLQANLLSDLEIKKLKLAELENPLFLKIKLKAIEIALDAEKIKLKKLEDVQFFGIKKNQFKNSIVAANSALDLTLGQAEVIKTKLINLDKIKKIIKNNMDELQELIAVSNKNKIKSFSKATEQNAMSLLLIDNEIQQNQNRLTALEERYVVELENERSEIKENLKSNSIKQINQKNKINILNDQYEEMILNNTLQIAQQKLEIDKIVLNLDQTKFNTANSIAKQKQSVNELE